MTDRSDPAPIPLTRPSTDEAELAAVASVLASGWLAGQGPQSTQLEAGFAALTGRAHAVAVNNCTAGLHLALAGLGVGRGDDVLVADYSFPATGHAVLFCQARPRFVDVRPDTGTIDPAQIEAAISPSTRGIVVVDALGMPADWAELEEIAANHGLFLVEDAACSAGAEYKGRPCGSFGDVAVFSLHARKGITSGEGGVLVTDSADLADRARRWACFGMRSAFERHGDSSVAVPSFDELGYNYKLSDVLAAVASVQLGKLSSFMERRQDLAERYARLLRSVDGVNCPTTPADRSSSWQTYAVTVDDALDRNRMISELRLRGIGCNIGTYSLSAQPVYNADPRACPVSAGLFAKHLALPMYSDLTDSDQDRVVRALDEVVGLVA